ncbi:MULTISPECIES: YlxR family protein [Streptomyces]|uniref:YlxR family protein n=1 Tax=Streptomyces TaxID=1883 RepID=UPI00055EB456|nr:YlxR family protein [Streptomyces sp. NRRL S-237]
MSGRTQARACPERTCVGCRERAAKNDLLRVVADGDACVPDPRGTRPGRGAYVHPAVVCLDQAIRRRAFPRALRSAGALDTENLRKAVADEAGHTAKK